MGMNYVELALETLNQKIDGYCKRSKWKDKEELDNSTIIIAEQVKLVREISLINTAIANQYLAKLQKLYIDKLHTEQFKEFRDQTINFNDDFVSDRERLYNMRKTESEALKKENMSMAEWKKVIKEEKKGTSSSGTGVNEREEPLKEKPQEEYEQEQGN